MEPSRLDLKDIEDGEIIFKCNKRDMIRLCPNGDIWIKGSLVTNGMDVVKGLRKLLTEAQVKTPDKKPEDKTFFELLNQYCEGDEEKMINWLYEPQTIYFGMSPAEFMRVNPKEHTPRLKSHLLDCLYGESMGR